MSRSEELWGVIEQQILVEKLIADDQIQSIRDAILQGTVSVDDWTLVIENTLLKGDSNGK